MTTPNRHARLAFASVAGTALEYYDFAVYNTLAALVFNQLFFPTFDPLAGTAAGVRDVLGGLPVAPGRRNPVRSPRRSPRPRATCWW